MNECLWVGCVCMPNAPPLRSPDLAENFIMFKFILSMNSMESCFALEKSR